ncbi:hypothetical protein [Labrenzia sp. DG1229]|nr:hypothetical protein [Labrenzia sp. DG1229]
MFLGTGAQDNPLRETRVPHFHIPEVRDYPSTQLEGADTCRVVSTLI